MKAPCKDCKKRHQACHDTCPDFKAWKEWRAIGIQKRIDENDITGAIKRSTMETLRRMEWKK